jgi:hypothetical protein
VIGANESLSGAQRLALNRLAVGGWIEAGPYSTVCLQATDPHCLSLHAQERHPESFLINYELISSIDATQVHDVSGVIEREPGLPSDVWIWLRCGLLGELPVDVARTLWPTRRGKPKQWDAKVNTNKWSQKKKLYLQVQLHNGGRSATSLRTC